MPSKTIVFIHGAWMVPGCWDDFRKPFEAAGYMVHAPAWPFLDGKAADLRANPPEGLGSLTVGEIADHYQAHIESLPEVPIVIGHSFGGLIVQMLLDRKVGAAGVAIDPGPIGGIVAGPTSLLGAIPILSRWKAWSRPYLLPLAAFRKNFANCAPAEIQTEAYDRLVVPTSGAIFFQAAFFLGTFVRPKRRRAPLLITGSEHDRTVTPYISRSTYRIQKRSAAKTDLKIFPGHSHFLIGEPGWEDVAKYVLDWVAKT
ncbi:alpha/beta fold hydrolase [soil metagenome]